jgi:hypothetical protein
MNTQSDGLDDPLVTTFYSQLLQLLEFTRDMDRNTSDSRFAKAGNHIHYVLDETVFEFFIGAHNQTGKDPTDRMLYQDKRKYSAAFHLEQWRDDPTNTSNERRWTRINRQTALITGEYLLGGDLPGQYKQRLYLTEWHATELRRRMLRLLPHFQTKASRSEKAASENIQRGIEAVVSMVSDPELKVEELIAKADIALLDLAAIRSDVKKLKGAGVDNSNLINFAAARILAANLIDDDVVEPLQQIRRIYSREIAGRIFPIQLLPPRPNEVDRESLEKKARKWQERLRAEEDHKKIIPTARRKSGALAADAETLAYIQWIAGRLASAGEAGEPKQRVVFITGDAVVFDAYRRWWINNPDQVFALRRIMQYAPILNFADAKSSVAFDKDIFENTRRAIEPRLMYFNLAERAGGAAATATDGDGRGWLSEMAPPASTVLAGGREHFALLLQEQNPLKSAPFRLFTQKVREAVAADREPYLFSIRDEWQELERLAIGVNYNLIERRLNDECRKELREFLHESEGSGIDAFIKKRLDEIYHYGAMRYVVGAFDVLRRYAQVHPEDTTSRPPIALRLRIVSPVEQQVPGTPPNAVDVSALANKLLNNNQVEETLRWLEEVWLGNPERLFALVATMALRLSLWDQAAIYAQLAVGSDAAETIKTNSKRDGQADYFELLYLRALANRFTIGAISSTSAGSEARAKQLFDAASNDLKACIEYHFGSGDKDERHLLRELRARSERVALQGFYATWLLLGTTLTIEALTTEVSSIVLRVQGAYDDLRIAIEILAAANHRADRLDFEKGSDEHSKFFSLIAKQIHMNIAAWYIFRELLVSCWPETGNRVAVESQMFVDASHVLKRMAANGEFADESPELLVDVFLFLWLFTRDEGARDDFRSLMSKPRESMLIIDAKIIELYDRIFGEVLGGPG